MKNKVLFTIFIVIILISTHFFIVFAANKSELQQESSNLQTKIDKTKQELGEVENNLSGVMSQIRDLTVQNSEYESEIDDLNSQISNLENEISEAEANLKQAEEDFKVQQKRLEDRLVALYEMGETSYLDVLLSSSIGSLISPIEVALTFFWLIST